MAPTANDLKILLEKINCPISIDPDDFVDISSVPSKIQVLNFLMDTTLQCLGGIRMICVDINERKVEFGIATTADMDERAKTMDDYTVHEQGEGQAEDNDDDDTEDDNANDMDEAEEFLTMNTMLSTFEFAVNASLHALTRLDSLSDEQEKYRTKRSSLRSSIFNIENGINLNGISAIPNGQYLAKILSPMKKHNHTPAASGHGAAAPERVVGPPLTVINAVTQLRFCRQMLREYPSASRLEESSQSGHDWLALNWFALATHYVDSQKTILNTPMEERAVSNILDYRVKALEHLVRVNPLMLGHVDSEGRCAFHFCVRMPGLDLSHVITLINMCVTF